MKRRGPKPAQVKRINLAELGISLKCSEECLRELGNLERQQALAALKSRNIIFD